jgi:hypothetical protein
MQSLQELFSELRRGRAREWYPGQECGVADAAVRVLMAEPVEQPPAARQTVDHVREEVAAEDHVDPRVTAAIQTGQQS